MLTKYPYWIVARAKPLHNFRQQALLAARRGIGGARLESLELVVEIDPRRRSRDMVDALAAIGVNRASLGVHDINPEMQRAVNRWQRIRPERRALARTVCAVFHAYLDRGAAHNPRAV